MILTDGRLFVFYRLVWFLSVLLDRGSRGSSGLSRSLVMRGWFGHGLAKILLTIGVNPSAKS